MQLISSLITSDLIGSEYDGGNRKSSPPFKNIAPPIIEIMAADNIRSGDLYFINLPYLNGFSIIKYFLKLNK